MKIVESASRSRNSLQLANRGGTLKNIIIEEHELASHAGARCASAVAPETQAAIQALLSSIEGREIEFRSVTVIEDSEPTNSWVTEGRVAVQMSHNQRINHE